MQSTVGFCTLSNSLTPEQFLCQGGWSHIGIQRSVRLCVCVCVRNAYLSNHLLLSAEISNTGRSQYFMKYKYFGRIAIKGFVFELWCDLLAWTAVARVRASLHA